MFTAIVWIGQYGSWSQGGFAQPGLARDAAWDEIGRGVFGGRGDLRVEVQDAQGAILPENVVAVLDS